MGGSFLLFLVLGSGFYAATAQGRVTSCRSNLHDLGLAVGRYYERHGSLPVHLDELTPEFLQPLPRCPAASKDTYSEGYSHVGDAYVLRCQGTSHQRAGLPPNEPSVSGVGAGEPRHKP